MSRAYCFTYFFPPDYSPYDPWAGPMDIDFERVRYFICQLERCPDTGRPHFQGYAQFWEKVRFKAASEALGMVGAHFEVARGNLESNQKYCSKDDTRLAGPWEGGSATQQGSREDLKEAAKMVAAGRMDLVEPTTYIKYHRGLHALAARDAAKRTDYPHVTVLWGPTGTGKSLTAEGMAGENVYWHTPGMWWDGYTTGSTVIIDDFNPSDYNATFMLRLLDKYPMKVPYKGGMTEFNSPLIIITTHFDPAYWYAGRTAEFERRLCEITEMVKE